MLTLDDILRPGVSFSLSWNDGETRRNIRYHIRAIVDEDVIVYKVWSQHKRNWCYSADTKDYFRLIVEACTVGRVSKTTTGRYQTRLVGNSGGDVFRLDDLGDGLMDLEVGHCCVYDISEVVPVEFLTVAINEVLVKHGSVEGVLKNSGWSEGFVARLLEKASQANQKGNR